MIDFIGNPQRQKTNIGAVDVYPNLLLSTLRPVLALPLLAVALSASAPSVKSELRADVYFNPVILGPVPEIRQLSDSAPPIILNVSGQPLTRPLTLGINPNAAILQLSTSAPYPIANVQADVYPNLLGSTLKPAGPAFALPEAAIRWDLPAPLLKYQVQVDITPNPVVLQAVPKIQRWDASAPPPKGPPQVDVTPNPVILHPVPLVQRLDSSAPTAKYQVQVDAYANVLVHGINANAKILGISDSAPPPKYQVQVDKYPNLLQNTLLPPAAPWTLPLSAQRSDFGIASKKVDISFDIPPNLALEEIITPSGPFPSLVGLFYIHAVRELYDLGFYNVLLEQGPFNAYQKIRAGIVVGQFPNPYSNPNLSDTITLTLSPGSLPSVRVGGIYQWFESGGN